MDPAAPGLPGLTTGPVRPADQPAVGWRYWQMAVGGARLRSLTARSVLWAPGTPVRARCRNGHAAPAEGCACGIYGATDMGSLHAQALCLGPEALIVGQVDLWGRLVDDGLSLRAEYGYPASLALVDGTVPADEHDGVLEHLAAYGRPVTTMAATEAVGPLSAAILAFQAMSR